jgi:hypothetical protein
MGPPHRGGLCVFRKDFCGYFSYTVKKAQRVKIIKKPVIGRKDNVYGRKQHDA